MEEILMKALAALLMVIFFGLCIIVHEWGHFLAARLCGLHVIAFSIGFKKAWGRKFNGVEYRIGWLPFGGYVDLPQIDASGEAKDENGNVLPKAEPWKRIVTAFAGPFFNILFGLLLGCFIWWFGLPQDSPNMTEFTVKSVPVDCPEYQAGLRKGDVIVKLNGKEINGTWGDLVRDIMLTVGGVTLDVRRGDQIIQVKYNPAINRTVAPKEELPYPFFKPEVPVILFPMKDSPAEKAGILPGDKVVKINGYEVLSFSDFSSRVRFCGGKPVILDIVRKDQSVQKVTVQPEPEEKNGEKLCLIGIQFASDSGLKVAGTIPGLPADGVLYPGDEILSLDEDVISQPEFQKRLKTAGAKSYTLKIKRGTKEITVQLNTVEIIPHVIGVKFYTLKYPSPFKQLENVIVMTGRSLKSLGASFKRKVGLNAGYTAMGPQHLSGPGGIGRILFLSFYQGSFLIGLNVVIIISFSLGLFNLLPIPVLDGGHIMLAVLEIVFRRPVPPKILQPVMYFFVAVLIGFMLYVTFYDVKKMLPDSLLETKGPGAVKKAVSPNTVQKVDVKNETKSK